MARSGRKIRVLLTEGSSLSARHTLYALGPDYVIDILDPQRLCQCRYSRFVRNWFRCPSFSQDPIDYLRYLAKRLKARKYDVLLPTHEQVFLLARFRDTFTQHVGVALSEFSALERMQSKARFVRLLDELDLPQPATRIVRSKNDLQQHDQFPCYVKLAHSTAGRGVHLVHDRSHLQQLAEDMDSNGQFDGDYETLIQQPAKGTQSTVQAVFQHGQLVGGHMVQARAIGVGGMASARVSVTHTDVLKHVARLGRHLNWHGAMFLDYFYDAVTENPEYIEANPRVGETVNAMLSGVNLCELLVQVSLGQTVRPPPPANIGVRTHSGFMILMTEAARGRGRRQLISEWWRAQTRKALYEDSQDELTRPGDDPLSLIPATAVGLQLLARPKSADAIVNRTVNSYCLPEQAAQKICGLPDDTMEKFFQSQT